MNCVRLRLCKECFSEIAEELPFVALSVSKGPVSGFVGDIPLPTLDSKI